MYYVISYFIYMLTGSYDNFLFNRLLKYSSTSITLHCKCYQNLKVGP